MKTSLLLISLLSLSTSIACTTCNKPVQRAIYGSTFYPNLLVMLSSFIIVGFIVIVLAWSVQIRHKRAIQGIDPASTFDPLPLGFTSIILGIGLGGFIDGIWFHQILQWHEMLSNKVPVTTVIGKSVNMFWDGVFHLFCWIIVLTGVILLWRLMSRTNVNKSGYLFSGGLLLGWGILNIVEGVVNHQLIRLHYVRQLSVNPDTDNFVLLGISVVLVICGISLMVKGKRYGSGNVA
jgi:uncharacterized membrane protein